MQIELKIFLIGASKWKETTWERFCLKKLNKLLIELFLKHVWNQEVIFVRRRNKNFKKVKNDETWPWRNYGLKIFQFKIAYSTESNWETIASDQ